MYDLLASFFVPLLVSLTAHKTTQHCLTGDIEGLFLKIKYQAIIMRPNYFFEESPLQNDWASLDGSPQISLVLAFQLTGSVFSDPNSH